MTLLAVLIRIIITLGFLWLVLRLFGKRGWQAARPLDLIVAVILGNIGNALLLGRFPLQEGFIALGLLAWLHLLGVVMLQRFPRLRTRLLGGPTILVRAGVMQQQAMDREHMTMDELAALLHEVGVGRLNEIQELRLEPDGSLSLMREASARLLTRRDIAQLPQPSQEKRSWPRAA